ncbi:hypothetical protein N867_10550 [Actinotalea fermentans ATCC 43279 = JCM 9966 = DSM 3133]|nr:hypothetical protein N867_10550 [Actinotalea fermentans ATCC 43279 = JCM 9966 = DSM 3133]
MAEKGALAARTVVFLSHTHRHGDFVVGSHHLSREFSAMGWRVAHVSTPYSCVHLVTGHGSRGRREGALAGPTLASDGVLDYVPRALLPAPAGSAGPIVRVLARYGFRSPDVVLLDQPKLARVAGLLGRQGCVVYRPTDIYVGRAARAYQNLALRVADAVVATSRPVLRDLGPLSMPAITIENGVEFDRFAIRGDVERGGVVYVGALDERFAWEDLAVLASAFPAVDFRIYGPVPRYVPDVAANVNLLGAAPYSAVPQLLAAAKVGLLPLTARAENSGRSPMKLYEYLAAGLGVLASKTPVTEALAGAVETYDSPAQAVAGLSRLLHEGGPAGGEELARQQDWRQKAEAIAEFALGIARRT